MCATGDLWSDQCIFRVEQIGIYLFQRIASDIIVAIAGCTEQTCFADTCLLHGTDHLQLVIFRRFVDRGKTILQIFQNIFSECKHLGIYAQGSVHFL